MAARRISIPANRIPSREVLRIALPWFLRDTTGGEPAESGSALFCFAADTFVDDLLAVAGGEGDLPMLVPWRDWSEPPAAMLDEVGAAAYPAGIARGGHQPYLPEPAGTGIDGDGIPSGDPPWLRKLYLPLHERFTMVAVDLVCRSAGWPPVDRGRVLGAGAVIRRLVADTGAERWQDWIAIDDKQGLWVEALDATMAPLTGGDPVDPGALPDNALVSVDARLRALLGIPLERPLGRSLTSHPLSLVPADRGEAGGYCTLFGYLPVFSAAREVPWQDLAVLDTATIAGLLGERTRTALDGLLDGVGALDVPAAEGLRVLLEQGLLPGRPDATPVSDALDAIRTTYSAPPDLDHAIARAVDRALRAALRLLLDRDASDVVRDTQIGGNLPTGNQLWIDSGAPDAAGQPGIASGWTARNIEDQSDDWDVLVRERLHQVAQAWLSGPTIPAPRFGDPMFNGAGNLVERDLWTIVLLACLRLRGARLTLDAYLSRELEWVDPTERLQALDDAGSPAATISSMGDEINAILGLEDGRSDPRSVPAWPPISYAALTDFARVLAIHEAGVALEQVYVHLDEGLQDAGSGAELQLQTRADARANQIDSVLVLPSGLASLRERGADLLEQPLKGLLVLPGLWSEPTDLATFTDASADRYGDGDGELAMTESRAHDQVPRLRLDADHIYAVWTWVRVAGREPCESERIVWSPGGEPFSIADPTDLLGARPANIRMPDIGKLLRDLPRINKAQARPFAAMIAPKDSGVSTGEAMTDTRRDWGIGFICSFGIPVLTICALILFNIIFHILIMLPGFAWMLLLKICFPFPRRES